MAARIVYEGVRATEGGGGTLFEGQTFHLMRRLPLIDHITNLIEANGGQLTNLEQNADIIIADHLRAAPKGAISYTYITKSVQNGTLEDIEECTVEKMSAKIRSGKGSAAVSRPNPAQAQPTKKGRTPFTAADDLLLMRFCMRMERQGASLAGNVIYKQLEEQHPHHTFHSWRDRWLNHVQHRARPDDLDEPGENDRPPMHRSPHKAPVSRPIVRSNAPISKPDTSKVLKHSSATKVNSSNNPTAKIAERIQRKPVPSTVPAALVPDGNDEFTQEDVELLLAEYDDIIALDEDKIIDAWMSWAEAYPWHTAQDWRNYFNKNVRGKRKQSISRLQGSGSPSSGSEKPTAKKGFKPHIGQSPQNQNHRSPQKHDTTLGSKRNQEQFMTREVKDLQGSSNRTRSSEDAQKSSQPVLSDEDNFNEKMRLVVETCFPDCDLELTPLIHGKRVKLYDLWNTVLSDNFIGANELDEEDRWHEVAEALGYEEAMRNQAGVELRACYDEFLAGLREAMESFDEVSGSQADEIIAEQLQQTASEAAERNETDRNRESEVRVGEEDRGDDDLDAPQVSPFVKHSSKRPSPSQLTPLKPKRQRVGRHSGSSRVEIPSTPEEELRSLTKPHAAGLPHSTHTPHDAQKLDDENGEQNANDALWEQFTKSPSPTKAKAMKRVNNSQLPIQQLSKMKSNEISPLHYTFGSRNNSHNSVGSSRSTPRRYSNHSQAGSSTQSHNNMSTQSQLGEFIQRCLGLGYSHDIVEKALHSTCLTIGGRSAFVMQALLEGKDIPEGTEGVWTEADDEDLDLWVAEKNGKVKGKGLEKDKGKGRAAYLRLVEKHGRDGVKERRKFLKSLES